MGNAVTSTHSTLSRQSDSRNDKKYNLERSTNNNNQQHNNPENSRVLFLLYLIHRTWNVVVDSVDHKGKRSRASGTASEDSGAPRSNFDEAFDASFTDLDDQSSLYGSQYSFCSCSYCEESERNHFDNIRGNRFSLCESDISYCFYQMAPSAGKSPPGTQNGPPDVHDMTLGWNSNIKENQRPPVFNPEDYVISLKKYGKRGANGNFKSIYDTADDDKNDKLNDTNRSHTLPHKNSDYKSPIQSPPMHDCEMTLRQFGSVTDLLTKLRADLRASFPSFVQEFVASPLDGVSLLLDVLRAVQLSQSMPIVGTTTMPPPGAPRNNQSYQRRALLDELACLQCLSICCSRSPEAGARLGTTPVGLLPLAAAATGTGIRSRIFALQLLTTACDRTALGDGTQRTILNGNSAVSEALSTLRLRCAEPVRFRLLVGMLNSSGGSGELQAIGMKFLNTFLDSSENTQNRLYLQAELHQAGLDPSQMSKTISSTSPWLEKLRFEIKRWECVKIDIDVLQTQARSTEQVRSRLVILERRVQILQEEKTVLTTMERRLQERCAELQREVLRLKGHHGDSFTILSLDKRPVALPRQVPPQSKRNTSENEDEGISSSETGQSLSPEPPRVFPSKEDSSTNSHKFSISLTQEDTIPVHEIENVDDDTNATIEDVIEELQNIVNDAEREILDQNEILFNQQNSLIKGPYGLESSHEYEIVPVNLLPNPPRKSRSLAHLISSPSEGDGSGYDLLILKNENKIPFFEDDGAEKLKNKAYVEESFYSEEENQDRPDIIHTATTKLANNSNHRSRQKDSNRAILNVIMDARDKESRMMRAHSLERDMPPPQKFNGVFFMADMNNPQKYPKPDITAALEAKKVTKNLDRIGAYGLDSMIDIVMTSDQKAKNMGFSRSRTNISPQNTTNNNNFKLRPNHGNVGLYSGGHLIRENSRSQSNIGGKVTDVPSGLY